MIIFVKNNNLKVTSFMYAFSKIIFIIKVSSPRILCHLPNIKEIILYSF